MHAYLERQAFNSCDNFPLDVFLHKDKYLSHCVTMVIMFMVYRTHFLYLMTDVKSISQHGIVASEAAQLHVY